MTPHINEKQEGVKKILTFLKKKKKKEKKDLAENMNPSIRPFASGSRNVFPFGIFIKPPILHHSGLAAVHFWVTVWLGMSTGVSISESVSTGGICLEDAHSARCTD